MFLRGEDVTNLEYWNVLCEMCASVHTGTYEYSKDRFNKEYDAISRLYYTCKKADEENEQIKQDFYSLC